jgi:hypothetical protein
MKRRDLVTNMAALASGGLLLTGPAAKANFNPPPDPNNVYDVRKYGAKGDGKTNDAAAIQKAINACSANGGGMVLVNNGTFLSSGISFKSNVELHIGATAILLGTPGLEGYNIDRQFDHHHHVRSFINADGCHHIALTGTGKIDGQGQLFPSNITYAERPYLIQLRGCKDVRLENVFLTNSAVWACWLLQCERVKVQGVHIENLVSPNRDGIDIDGCREVHISNCNINTEDDSIAFKVSQKGHPCRDIVVTNCIISSRCAAIRFGPDAIDNIENVTISNCAIRNTKLNGIKIQESMGASIKNITISNITMDNVRGPISVRLAGWKLENPDGAPFDINDDNWENGKVQNILFNNITGTTPKDNIAISITGTSKTRPGQLSFSNIDLTFTGGGTAAQGARRNVPDMERDYPEMYIFGDLPAYALYMHHVSGVVLENVHFRLQAEDLRPAIVCDDVDDLELSSVKLAGSTNGESVVRLQNTKNVFIHATRTINSTATFLRVEGSMSSDILLSGNKLNRSTKIVEATAEVPKDAVSNS